MDRFFDQVLIEGSADHSLDLIAFFRDPATGGTSLPEPLSKFVAEVERVNLLIIDGLDADRDRERRQEILKLALGAARVGAQGDHYNTALGTQQLALVEKLLLRRVAESRKGFLGLIYRWAAIWALSGLLLLSLLGLVSEGVIPLSTITPTAHSTLAAFAYSMLGIALGVSITSVIRLRQVTPELIGKFDPYDFSPSNRFFYVTLLAIGIFVLLYFDVVQIGLGSVLLNQVRDFPAMGTLVGLAAGASEPVLASIFEKGSSPTTSSAGKE
ncbi:hypothetical protein Thimo_0815 [Thioflavicoccus mobilis 8321]|uniref:Uncharacterized protein n=1 Tax=Thioflavicoccus mobilis 8321 TaxID=765912 RepID=L0GUZ9_9GAMM|nr:hypothetical protein [Thioflavicoccus mobilis]AGA89652.1 hypothetical protein Thimo_0815 [Thioflavicoccus mobilis 8321]